MKYITVLEIFPSFTAIFAPLHTVDALYDHKTGNDLKVRAVRTIHVKIKCLWCAVSNFRDTVEI